MKLGRLLVLFLIAGSACTYDNEEDLFGEVTCPPDLTLSQDALPIIEANCAVPSCHVTGTSLPNFRQSSVIVNRSAGIRARTRNRTMPPPSSGFALTEVEIQVLSCWVEQGSQSN